MNSLTVPTERITILNYSLKIKLKILLYRKILSFIDESEIQRFDPNRDPEHTFFLNLIDMIYMDGNSGDRTNHKIVGIIMDELDDYYNLPNVNDGPYLFKDRVLELLRYIQHHDPLTEENLVPSKNLVSFLNSHSTHVLYYLKKIENYLYFDFDGIDGTDLYNVLRLRVQEDLQHLEQHLEQRQLQHLHSHSQDLKFLYLLFAEIVHYYTDGGEINSFHFFKNRLKKLLFFSRNNVRTTLPFTRRSGFGRTLGFGR